MMMRVLQQRLLPLALILFLCLAQTALSVPSSYQPKKDEEEISPNGMIAEITSCAGCSLVKNPAVRTFLTEGEAESYRGVSVIFVQDGRDPVMVVREQHSGGKQVQQVFLNDYRNLQDLHELMSKLGFQKRTKKEYDRYKIKQRRMQEEHDQEYSKTMLEDMKSMKQKKKDLAKRARLLMEENLKKQAADNLKVKA